MIILNVYNQRTFLLLNTKRSQAFAKTSILKQFVGVKVYQTHSDCIQNSNMKSFDCECLTNALSPKRQQIAI